MSTMANPAPKIHIRSTRWTSLTLCGLKWEGRVSGRIASDTTPPAVVDDDSGSVYPATCVSCLTKYAAQLALPKP